MKLKELVEKVREYERELAYGSETTLWGDFWAEYRGKIGDDETLETSDLEIPQEEADMWLAAYTKMAEYENEGVSYDIEDLF